MSVNCAALPPTLIESELFGHERGAFTGAVAPRQGRFEIADRGTLFLDEIGDLPLELQSKLLRVIQEGEFERLGSSQSRKVDTRLIVATHRDLGEMAASGRFRTDLLYRLNVFPIRVPTLRERREDIPRLVWYIIHRRQRPLRRTITKVPDAVMEMLQGYDWPGNVRELENVIERAMIRSSRRYVDDVRGTEQPHSSGVAGERVDARRGGAAAHPGSAADLQLADQWRRQRCRQTWASSEHASVQDEEAGDCAPRARVTFVNAIR